MPWVASSWLPVFSKAPYKKQRLNKQEASIDYQMPAYTEKMVKLRAQISTRNKRKLYFNNLPSCIVNSSLLGKR